MKDLLFMSYLKISIIFGQSCSLFCNKLGAPVQPMIKAWARAIGILNLQCDTPVCGYNILKCHLRNGEVWENIHNMSTSVPFTELEISLYPEETNTAIVDGCNVNLIKDFLNFYDNKHFTVMQS